MAIGCAVMAAGNARRFGDDKLAAEVGGKSLLRRALEAVPAEEFGAVAVVVRRLEAAELAADFGFCPVYNPRPDWGASHTVRLALEALGDCGAALFLVADQPFLRRETVKAMVSLHRRCPEKLLAAAHGGVRGNPCLFPAKYFPELLDLRGDRGGGQVIGRHPGELLLLEVPARELEDVDTPAALEALRRL